MKKLMFLTSPGPVAQQPRPFRSLLCHCLFYLWNLKLGCDLIDMVRLSICLACLCSREHSAIAHISFGTCIFLFSSWPSCIKLALCVHAYVGDSCPVLDGMCPTWLNVRRFPCVNLCTVCTRVAGCGFFTALVSARLKFYSTASAKPEAVAGLFPLLCRNLFSPWQWR